MLRTICVANQKGGVGKTTTSINIAAALARRGRKVLIFDMDPQGNASSGLGVKRYDFQDGNAYHVLLGEKKIYEAVQPTALDGLDVVAANPDLVGVEIELVDMPQREYRLKTELASVREKYDYCFIDCPPSLGLLTVNALTASNTFLVPLQCEYYALEGLSQLLNTAGLIKKNLNPELKIEGIVLTMFDKRNNLSHQVVQEIRAHFGDKVFQSVIPRNVRLSEAPSHGMSIFEYDPRSIGAKRYDELARELDEKIFKERVPQSVFANTEVAENNSKLTEDIPDVMPILNSVEKTINVETAEQKEHENSIEEEVYLVPLDKSEEIPKRSPDLDLDFAKKEEASAKVTLEAIGEMAFVQNISDQKGEINGDTSEAIGVSMTDMESLISDQKETVYESKQGIEDAVFNEVEEGVRDIKADEVQSHHEKEVLDPSSIQVRETSSDFEPIKPTFSEKNEDSMGVLKEYSSDENEVEDVAISKDLKDSVEKTLSQLEIEEKIKQAVKLELGASGMESIVNQKNESNADELVSESIDEEIELEVESLDEIEDGIVFSDLSKNVSKGDLNV